MTTTKLSAKQAAKEIGKATSTVTTAIKQGRLSALKNDNGSFEIEPAELFRVFPPKPTNQTRQDPEDKTIERANDNGALHVEIKYLGEQVEDLKARLTTTEKRLDYEREILENRCEAERAERLKITALLEHQTKTPQPVAPQSQNIVLIGGVLIAIALSVASFVFK